MMTAVTRPTMQAAACAGLAENLDRGDDHAAWSRAIAVCESAFRQNWLRSPCLGALSVGLAPSTWMLLGLPVGTSTSGLAVQT